jgi:hypothetical protein
MGGQALEFSNYVKGAPQDEKSAAEEMLRSVQQQLKKDDETKHGRSYLGTALDFVWRFDEASNSQLKNYEKEIEKDVKDQNYGAVSKMREEVETALKKDSKHHDIQDGIDLYGGTALKIGALFYGGKVGWGATAGMYALDSAHPADDGWKQALDFGLGATKGVAYKGMLNGVMESTLPLPAKGLALSLGGRGLDTLLTSDNYYDRKTGQYNFSTGLTATGRELTDLKHLAIDGAVMTVGFGLGYGLNRFLGPVVSNSPLWSRIATSGMAGVSRGAIGEVAAMEAAGEQFSFQRVARSGALMGTVYALAAVPGAIQADHQYHVQHQHDGQQPDHAKDGVPTNDNTAEMQFREFKKVGTVRAEQLHDATTWTTSKGEVMQAAAGDFKLTGADGSTWSVKPDIFQQTYSPVAGSAGEFAKTAITRASQLTQPITIQTLEGQGSGQAGDYLIRGPKGEEYIVPKAKFESMYVPKS